MILEESKSIIEQIISELKIYFTSCLQQKKSELEFTFLIME